MGARQSCLPFKTSNVSFWIGARVGRTSRRLGRRVVAVRSSCARVASAKNIFGTGDENAGAAGLAPNALVTCARCTVVVVAREELAFVDPQLTVEEMQLFYACMSMRGVSGAGRETYQHANPVPCGVGRQQLAFDPGRNLFPFRFGPLRRRRQHWLLAGLLGDAQREARLQRCSRTKQIGGPGDEPVEHRTEELDFALTVRARGDMRFRHGSLARRQRLSRIRAR